MTEKSISEFLSDEYKEFAMYVIEGRAIPSVIDGFKPTQRKIIHIANQIWRTGNEKTLKVFQLSGKVASDCFYHHGDMSLSNAIITMAQRFKNNAPLLEEEGQFGSLRSPQPGAPRYIGTKLSENFRLIYKDFDLLKFKEEEGEVIEPHYFLPIVPTVLLNGSSGIAVGFASNILNRDIKTIIDACLRVLNGKEPGEISPSLNGFTGEYIQDTENKKRWIIRGKFVRTNTSTVKISELPPSMTYEKYEDILDKLVDDKLIVSYDDNCKDNIDYTIKFTRADLDKLDDEKLVKLLKLEESSTEIFSTLDEFGKLMIFECTQEIIKYFVNFRLEYYHKRKAYLLERMNKKFENFVNISIIISILYLFQPMVELIIEKIGRILIIITQKTFKILLYMYLILINSIWIYLFYVICNDSYKKYIELEYNINLEHIMNITNTHFENIFVNSLTKPN